jgi:hypothetical protein
MARDESGVLLGGGSNKDSPVASLSRLRPLPAQAPLQGHVLRFSYTRWRSRAATWVSLMTLGATPPRYSA